VFNETNRDEVIADLVGWIGAHVLQERGMEKEREEHA
jgi:hypothetical protein